MDAFDHVQSMRKSDSSSQASSAPIVDKTLAPESSMARLLPPHSSSSPLSQILQKSPDATSIPDSKLTALAAESECSASHLVDSLRCARAHCCTKDAMPIDIVSTRPTREFHVENPRDVGKMAFDPVATQPSEGTLDFSENESHNSPHAQTPPQPVDFHVQHSDDAIVKNDTDDLSRTANARHFVTADEELTFAASCNDNDFSARAFPGVSKVCRVDDHMKALSNSAAAVGAYILDTASLIAPTVPYVDENDTLESASVFRPVRSNVGDKSADNRARDFTANFDAEHAETPFCARNIVREAIDASSRFKSEVTHVVSPLPSPAQLFTEALSLSESLLPSGLLADNDSVGSHAGLGVIQQHDRLFAIRKDVDAECDRCMESETEADARVPRDLERPVATPVREPSRTHCSGECQQCVDSPWKLATVLGDPDPVVLDAGHELSELRGQAKDLYVDVTPQLQGTLSVILYIAKFALPSLMLIGANQS